MAAGVPPALGLCASALVFALGAQQEHPAAEAGAFSVPQVLADYSHVTGNVSSSPAGPAVALFQHGFGVELLDFPQAVVLGAGGDTYRRVDEAEGRAGAETQGDPAPMLLSPDGRFVAVGDHDTDDPDVVVVDLTTGEATTHPLPQGSSVVPLAWSNDGESIATLLSSEPTNPYAGTRIKGDLGILDLSRDTTALLREGGVTAVAFSPDDAALAVERSGSDGFEVSILDGDGQQRDVGATGPLAGPTAWSPDGRLLAITTVEPSGAPAGVDAPGRPNGMAFVDATGAGGTVPAPLELPLSGAGRVLAWNGPDEVVVLLGVDGGSDEATLSGVPLDGSEPRTLMRLDDLGSYGVGRFQMAAAAGGRLTVVSPGSVDRGPWPLPLRMGAAVLAGLVVWLGAWLVLRVAVRARRRRSA